MENYEEIINLPHHVSNCKKQMSMHDRAAQFSPFAALVGYDDCIDGAVQLMEQAGEQEDADDIK